MNNNLRSLALWAVIGFFLIMLYQFFNNNGQQLEQQDIIFSEFLHAVDAGAVKEATIMGQRIAGRLKTDVSFQTVAPEGVDLVDRLISKDVMITAKQANDGTSTLLDVFMSYIPMIILIGVWIFFMRQMQGSNGRVMGFGKSKAKLLSDSRGRVLFDDVAGIDEAKEELQEIVEFLRNPRKFQRLGGRIPKGALLIGPPGTGKTLLARAIAGEANVPFFTISGSDFVEMFVGVGASRVRDMFEQSKKKAPCIIFIDEIDAVGRHRGAGLGGGNDEREQTLNQLLVEMDGFEASESIILIAATNRPDVLDPALLRPGRFDRQVIVSNPDIIGREKILKVHVRKVVLSSDVDLKTVARGTPGFSGADLMNLVNEAALLAARRSRNKVTHQDFEDAKDKILMGAERRTLIMSEQEKRLTAYHEAGHALVALSVPESDPVHKVTIIPRGRALGMVMQLPERDQLSLNLEQMSARLAVMMGGRVAEEITFGKDKVTSGAASDIQQATYLARSMVMRWGLSDELGAVMYGDNQDEVFLGHSIARQQKISEDTSHKIDVEVRRLIKESLSKANEILTKDIKNLEILAIGLLEYETLSGKEIKDLLDGKPPVREAEPDESKGHSSSVPTVGKRRDERESRGKSTGDQDSKPQV